VRNEVCQSTLNITRILNSLCKTKNKSIFNQKVLEEGLWIHFPIENFVYTWYCTLVISKLFKMFKFNKQTLKTTVRGNIPQFINNIKFLIQEMSMRVI